MEKFEIKDIQENLTLLCKNLDGNFLGYNAEDVKKFLKEAKSSIKVFANDKFIENKIVENVDGQNFIVDKGAGEKFLRYCEDFNSEMGSFEEFIEKEKSFKMFYKDFNDKVLNFVRNSAENFSKNFKELVEEIDKYLRKKTLRILHELGFNFS